jgi:PPOX class probable F420-dependent enzyme
MDASDVKEFLKENNRAVLATHRSDRSVQISPVLAVLDAEGRAAISSRETAFKVRHLRRDPRATLCVLNDGFFGRWAYLQGDAEIVSLPDAMEGLVDYYRRAAGEHEDWDDYRRAMKDEQRCLIRIPIERAGPRRAG